MVLRHGERERADGRGEKGVGECGSRRGNSSPTVAVAVGEDGANEGGGEGGTGRVDEEEDEGAGGSS